TLQTQRDAVSLPTIAVNQGPNGPFAYVVENDVAVVRPLAIDVRQDEMTTVKSGLQPGDAVVISDMRDFNDTPAVTIGR
ncbi:MAG TPA: hypothetical protein VL176_10875, partial [Steroidobacteraceae bacterium]|nr:hypothetical protein [Steroidobacteraceae bacterium]